jgi:hypothetical protein
MPRSKCKQPKTVHSHISFFWDTRLTNERMEEINAWVATLTEEQLKMLHDLQVDSRQEGDFSSSEGC